MRSFALVSLAGLAAAQVTQLFNFTLDIGQVDPVERSNWCKGEENTCQALCPGRPDSNTCDDQTLNMECTCSNGTAPGLEFYDASLYSFVCREAFNQCNIANAGDAAELKACVTDIRDTCGTLTIEDPAEATGTSGDDSPDSTSDSDAGQTTEASNDESNDNGAATMFASKGAAAVMAIGLVAALF